VSGWQGAFDRGLAVQCAAAASILKERAVAEHLKERWNRAAWSIRLGGGHPQRVRTLDAATEAATPASFIASVRDARLGLCLAPGPAERGEPPSSVVFFEKLITSGVFSSGSLLVAEAPLSERAWVGAAMPIPIRQFFGRAFRGAACAILGTLCSQPSPASHRRASLTNPSNAGWLAGPPPRIVARARPERPSPSFVGRSQ
jgi:hypothetical protein